MNAGLIDQSTDTFHEPTQAHRPYARAMGEKEAIVYP